MKQFVFEQPWSWESFEIDDGGQAKIYHINNEENQEVFVRIQSWDETKEHKDFSPLEGKMIRVTIEIFD